MSVWVVTETDCDGDTFVRSVYSNKDTAIIHLNEWEGCEDTEVLCPCTIDVASYEVEDVLDPETLAVYERVRAEKEAANGE